MIMVYPALYAWYKRKVGVCATNANEKAYIMRWYAANMRKLCIFQRNTPTPSTLPHPRGDPGSAGAGRVTSPNTRNKKKRYGDSYSDDTYGWIELWLKISEQ